MASNNSPSRAPNSTIV